MTLLFVVAGVAAYHTLQHKAAKQFIAGRRNKLLVPSTLGVLVFGFIPGSIVAGASAGAGLQAAPGFVKYIVYTLSGMLGDMIFLVSVLCMKDSWRAGIPDKDRTKLVTTGIYRYSRNPAFLGFDFMYVGLLLMYFNLSMFVVIF